ncbi:piggyBac transposable element-derived protein 4-like [Episyrphus balteatus]|uniref:piggyBac transposable element-derived protein 4-like n=1 Tax=Episyrphus balteatus TaxID=286459 RepID=UPI002485D427|nr:piggyBac transposable element-derived protein 4-like [Episyrphus balteatus]
MDSERIRLMFEEENSDSNYEDENDSDVEDLVEQQEADIDTEQDDDSESDAEVAENSADYYIGKDNHTKWKKNRPSMKVRRHNRNIVTQLPGVKGEAKNLKESGDIWKLFFTENVMSQITAYTNQQIKLVTPKCERERDCSETDEVEIQALFGLLLFAGVRRNSRLNAKDLFKTDGSSPDIFRLTMSWNRFYLLLRCLRFDEKSTRPVRSSVDKLAPIRDLFEEIIASFKKYFSPSQFVTIDEKLEAFRGRCNFRQYIPSKPNRYGIKIYALTDAKMFYTSDMEVYLGKQPEGPYFVDNSAMALVLRLSNVIHNSGRNITIDNFFTSLPLIDKLKRDYRLTVLGTIRKNKRELPKNFTDVKRREVSSSLFGHRGICTLVSYVPKKNKNVLLVSSMHDNQEINEETGKPEMIMDYNATKGGVDTVDKMCATYNVARGTNRWPMVIFYSLMNVAGINSYVIYGFNNQNKKINRRTFLEALSYDLINVHLRKRAYNTCLPRSLRQRITDICKLDGPESSVTANNTKIGRCSYCSSKKNRKTRYNCVSCKTYFCLEHAIMVCLDCQEKTSGAEC